jgi:hypothetical protein
MTGLRISISLALGSFSQLPVTRFYVTKVGFKPPTMKTTNSFSEQFYAVKPLALTLILTRTKL